MVLLPPCEDGKRAPGRVGEIVVAVVSAGDCVCDHIEGAAVGTSEGVRDGIPLGTKEGANVCVGVTLRTVDGCILGAMDGEGDGIDRGSRQKSLLPSLKIPGDPGPQNNNGLQREHDEAPSSAYVPGPQRRQEPKPSAQLDVPGVHGVQRDAPSSANVPAGQMYRLLSFTGL